MLLPETDACRMRGQMRVYPEKKRKKNKSGSGRICTLRKFPHSEGGLFFCVHKYAEESVCVPWGTEGEHANPGVVRRSSGLGSLMRVVCGGRRSFRGQGGRD